MRPDKQLAGPARPDRRRHDAGERVHARRRHARAGPGHRHRHDAVPRRRRPLRAQRRHGAGDALLERVDRDERARADLAQRRHERRLRVGVHVRPRAVGRPDPPGQPGVGRAGARRHDADPLRRPVLRPGRGRQPAELGRPEQGRDPAGGRAAATAREPDRDGHRRQEADPALLVPPARAQGRGHHDRRRPRRTGWHGRPLRGVRRGEPGRLQRRAVGVHPRDVVRLSAHEPHERAGRELRVPGLRGRACT